MKDLAEFDREETTELRKIFWQIFIDNQFIKSTNSITDEVEEFECGVIDMEATVDIRGEFDKDQIEKSFEEWIKSHDARRDAMMRKELLGRMPKMKKVQEGIYCGCDGECFADCPDSFNKAMEEITSIIASVFPESGLMDISSLTK